MVIKATRVNLTAWQLKVIVNALRAYGPDSSEAAQYPEDYWTFVRKLSNELDTLEIPGLSDIEKPDDQGLGGETPKPI